MLLNPTLRISGIKNSRAPFRRAKVIERLTQGFPDRVERVVMPVSKLLDRMLSLTADLPAPTSLTPLELLARRQ
jgi:hypothetical protein